LARVLQGGETCTIVSKIFSIRLCAVGNKNTSKKKRADISHYRIRMNRIGKQIGMGSGRRKFQNWEEKKMTAYGKHEEQIITILLVSTQ
jgi:hypothetical protein